VQLADRGYRYLAGHDNLWSWRFRLLEAEALLAMGKFQETDKLLGEIPPAGSPFDIVVRRRILQGRALCRLGRAVDSVSALNEAEHLLSSSQGDLQAELVFARGKCSIADFANARSYYLRSAELAHGFDIFLEARSLGDAGYSYLKERNYTDAIKTLNRALSITDSTWLRELGLGNLAECYAELGDWRQSIFFAEEAEKLASQIKRDGNREVLLIDLGRAHSNLFEFSKAEPYFGQALTIARSLNDMDAMSRCLNDLTQLALRRHDLTAAERYWKEESALSLSPERKVYVTFDAAMIALERQEFSKAELLLKEILKSNAKGSLRLTSERELGNAYWQENKIIEADRAFRQAINDVEDTISRLPSKYQMSFLDEDPFYDSYVRFLVAQGRMLDALKIVERGRAQILSQAVRDTQGTQSSFDLKTLQRVLTKSNKIALAYSLTNDASFLWVITPAQFKVLHLPSQKTIRLLIDAYKSEIVDHPRSIEDSPGSQQLYKILIQPAESLIPKGSRVVIITSKILSLVNFEALIVPGADPHYWIGDVEIETASSLALLAHPRPWGGRSAKRKQELLLLGAPLEADKAFPTLNYASEEMNRVGSHFPADRETIISGKEAIPPAYRASNPGDYRFIHIDAHSAASELNPLDSFVVLSPTAGNSYKLFAHEITDTPLRADLVTLSACYGAGTRWYNGEGIVGLGWAFLRAGAHQVVASLWAVDDASTPQLMDDFYSELSRGKSAAEALRAAKLKMLHSDGPKSRPFYWASLQLYTGS
jgi:CHAT domain-containing protein